MVEATASCCFEARKKLDSASAAECLCQRWEWLPDLELHPGDVPTSCHHLYQVALVETGGASSAPDNHHVLQTASTEIVPDQQNQRVQDVQHTESAGPEAAADSAARR
jgi:hypothetical protein